MNPLSEDSVLELSCNLDDMTGEEIGFAMERLLEAGVLDVWTEAIGMKKCRPGVLLRVLCREEDRDKLVPLLFLHTTTLGIRENVCRRYVLRRTVEQRETRYGPVRVKRSEGWGVTRCKIEYEDLSRIARETGKNLEEVRKELGSMI